MTETYISSDKNLKYVAPNYAALIYTFTPKLKEHCHTLKENSKPAGPWAYDILA